MGSLMEYRLIAVFRNTSRSFSTGRPATTPYSCAHTRPVICAAANKRITVGGSQVGRLRASRERRRTMAVVVAIAGMIFPAIIFALWLEHSLIL